MDDMQPGQVIIPIPHNSDDPKPAGDGAPEPERPVEQPKPDPGPIPAPTPIPETAVPAVTPVPAEPNFYTPQPTQAVNDWQTSREMGSDPIEASPEDISWTAAEFVAHEKGFGWYGLLTLIGLGAAALDYFLVKDIVSTIVIAFATIMFALYAARKPRNQEYSLSHQGVQVGMRSYSFHDFKNFSVTEEAGNASVVFMPLKRFMPPLTIYVAANMEDQVLDFLVTILPFEEHRTDAIDSLLRRIRF